MHIVQQSVSMPATPSALYQMYLDPVQHAEFTGGGPVRIAAVAGAEFWAFDGRISGSMLALTPGRQIVQRWRSFEWQADDLDSMLVLTFWPDQAGGRIELAHVNVPGHLHEKLEAGWPMRYWDPWRAYLERRR